MKNKDIMKLGELIAEARKKKGYSQRKFAQISGLSNTTISRIENGDTQHPDIETLKVIATHLDIEEKKLLSMAGGSASKISTKTKPKAKINFLQQPVKRIKRYSTVAMDYPEQAEELEPERIEIPATVKKPKAEKISLRGMHLITLRLEKNITQKELADALGIDKTLISQYEGEILKPDYDIVEKMAEFFGVTVDYLVNKQEEKPVMPTPTAVPKENRLLRESNTVKLQPEYLEIAKEIQEAGIAAEDVRLFIDMIKKYRR